MTIIDSYIATNGLMIINVGADNGLVTIINFMLKNYWQH